jgi:hypothetical protein
MTTHATPRMATASCQGRARWAVGFGFHLALVSTVIVAAYLGRLPDVGIIGRYDYVGHAVMIGFLAFFLDGALGFRPLLPGARLPWLRLAPVLVIVVAGAEELLQRLSPHRTCSITDFAGDVVGVFALAWLALRIERRRTAGERRGGATPSNRDFPQNAA